MTECKCGHDKIHHNDYGQCCIILPDDPNYKFTLGFNHCLCRHYEEFKK